MFSVTPFSTAGFSAAGEAVADLSATLGSLTPAAATKVLVSASATNSLDGLSISASAKVRVAGTTAATLGALSVTATGTVKVAASSAKTLDVLSSAATGKVAVSGASSVTLAGIGLASAGKVAVSGASASSLAPLVDVSTGAVRVSCSVSSLLSPLSGSSAAVVRVAGSCSVTLGALAPAAAAKVAVSASSARALSALSFASTGKVAVLCNATGALSSAVVSASSRVRVSAAVNATLGGLAVASTGRVLVAAASAATLVDSFQSGCDLDSLGCESSVGVLVAGVVESGVTGQPLTIDQGPFSGAPFSSLDETYVTPLLEQLLCHSEVDVLVLADLNATLVNAFQSGRDLDGLQLQADGLVRWLYDLDRELDAATSESELVLGGIGDQPATGLVVTPSDLGESAGGEDFSHTLTVQYIDPATLSPQVINALSITPPTDWRFDIETSGLGSSTIRVVISGRTPDIFSGQWTYIVDESVMEGGHPKLTVSPYNLIPARIFALVRYEAGKETKTPLDFVFSANGGTATVTKWVLNDLNAGKKLIPVVNCRSERRAPGTEESCRVLLAEAA